MSHRFSICIVQLFLIALLFLLFLYLLAHVQTYTRIAKTGVQTFLTAYYFYALLYIYSQLLRRLYSPNKCLFTLYRVYFLLLDSGLGLFLRSNVKRSPLALTEMLFKLQID